jgi:hypothetical protein
MVGRSAEWGPFPIFTECLLGGFMIRDGLLCFAPPKRFSLSRRQAWIGDFLIVYHFPWPYTQPGGFFFEFAGRSAYWLASLSVSSARPELPANRTEQPNAASIVEDEEHRGHG